MEFRLFLLFFLLFGTLLMCVRWRSEAISVAISFLSPANEKCMLNGFNINHQVNKAFTELFMLMSSMSSFYVPQARSSEKISANIRNCFRCENGRKVSWIKLKESYFQKIMFYDAIAILRQTCRKICLLH